MRYIGKKALTMIVTLLLISLLAFLAFEIIPGDPVTKILGTEYTPERARELRAELGLDRNIFLRYFSWLAGFFTGDLGLSYNYNMPVNELLEGRVGITACLSLMAFVLTVLISIPLGMRLARIQGGAVDRIFTVLNQVLMSIPSFFIGIIFTSIFGLGLKLFVVGDFVYPGESFWGFLGYLFFPALAIAIPKSAMTVKLLRSSILAELDEDYVRTAYSRGNSRVSVLRNHVLRNSIIPVITFLAVTIADIVAGSIIIEQLFTVPGIGRMLLLAISNRDFPVVLAIVMMIAALVLVVNFLADVIYQLVDPRIRLR